MASACGVTWDGTSSGKLDESEIPNPPEHKSHYLNAAETKGDSSFPVVDGDGNLRAGNVNAAWDLRNQGEGVSEECLRKMDDSFDENVLPDSAYENAEFAIDPPEWQEGDIVQWQVDPEMVGRVVTIDEEANILMVTLLERDGGSWVETGYTITAGYTDVRKVEEQNARQMASNYNETVTVGSNDTDGKFGMNIEFTQLPTEALADGFNQYGVRENEDGSLDVRFQAMEPGVRKGVEITEEFLRDVSSRDYSRIPIQLDHSDSQRANVGYTKPGNIEFTGEFLATQIHIPNTGSSVRDDIIADFTHEPPQVKDISVAFDPRSMQVEKPSDTSENPKFTSGRIREFSLTPFPAGYDNGGLTPEFSAAVEQAIIGPDETEEPESQLITRPHTLIKNYD
jgi:hypothetical protein